MRGGRKITKSLDSSLPVPTGNDSMVEKMGGEIPKCWTYSLAVLVALHYSAPFQNHYFLVSQDTISQLLLIYFFFLKGSKSKVNFSALF